MRPNIRIAILILNYNGKRYLSPLFEALQFLKGDPRVDVVLIDNASYDGSLEWSRKFFPWVRCIRNEENYGWGEGYNRGIEKLKHANLAYSHYLFLNNDTVPNITWFGHMYDAVCRADAKVGEFGCRTVFADNIVQERVFKESSIWREDCAKMIFLNAGSHSDFLFDEDAPIVRTSPSAKRKGVFKGKLPDEAIGYTLQVENNSSQSLSVSLASDLKGNSLGSVKGVELFQVQEGGEGVCNFVIPQKSKILVYRSFADDHQFIPFIQNSGIGLNKRFEGYDLQTYEPCDRTQDFKSLVGICGVAKLVSSEAFEKLNGFDPQYFMYYEDLDFSIRLRKAGYESKIIPEAILSHHHGGSSNVHSKFFARQVSWSLLYFQWRHGSGWRKCKSLLSVILRARSEDSLHLYRSRQVNRFALTKFLQNNTANSRLIERIVQWSGGTYS